MNTSVAHQQFSDGGLELQIREERIRTAVSNEDGSPVIVAGIIRDWIEGRKCEKRIGP